MMEKSAPEPARDGLARDGQARDGQAVSPRGSAGKNRSGHPGRLDGGRRRRAAGAQPRRRQLLVRFAEHEWLLVVDAAARDGLALGAWVGDLACQVAGGDVDAVPASWAELVRELMRARAGLLALTTALDNHAFLRRLSDMAASTGDDVEAAAPAAPDLDAAGLDAPRLREAAIALVGRLDELLDAVIASGPLSSTP